MRFYLVWTDRKDKDNYPLKRHESRMSACDEANRLANKHVGITFDVMERVDSYIIEQKPLSRLGIIKKLKKLKDALNDSNESVSSIELAIEKLITRVKE